MAAEGLQNAVITLLQAAESGLLAALHSVGLAPLQHGQPAWPFAERLATETLGLDAGLTRQVAVVVAGLVLALALAALGAAWRKGRWPLLASAAVLFFLLPWPSRSLVLTEAHATSFARSPSGFQVDSIERGLALFQSQCASCHGADGRGEGPLAAGLAVWPPRLTGVLLWRRPEGETFWHILHGMRDRHGTATMPGFDGRLDAPQAWALIDAMKVMAAGTSVREDAAWSEPILAPDAWVRCRDGTPARRLSSLRGQRVRLVAGGGAQAAPREDPRLVTIELRRPGRAAGFPCEIDAPGAYAVFAQISGTPEADFAGAQLIVDRDGWLRAYGRPGQSAWSQGDLLCRAAGEPGVAPVSLDGLGDLIAAIDAQPIRSSALGLAHGP